MLWIGQAIAFNLLKRFIRLKFPHVQQITNVEFAQALTNATQSQLLILDARSEAEYAVSHFAEARRLEETTDGAIAPALQNISKDSRIVIYCSVGYRSAKVAQQLTKAGFQDVSNLEGGLFQWANEGHTANLTPSGTLVQAGQPTHLVHPYGAIWKLLLDKQHRF